MMVDATDIQRKGSGEAADAEFRRIIFTAVKDEGIFVLEWIAYHRAIGFDTIVVASNDCSDGTEELLAALDAAGEIVHIPHSPAEAGLSPQASAGQAANARGIFRDGDWVLWIDVDEFLNVHAGAGTVDDLIEAMGGAQAMIINWRIFGDSGNATFPGRLISGAFTKASARGFQRNDQAKAFWKVGASMKEFALDGIHRPRVDPAGGLTAEEVLGSDGAPIDGSEKGNQSWLAGKDAIWINHLPLSPETGKLAQINHYLVRTRDVFALKKARGRGTIANQIREKNNRHTLKFFEHCNRNDETDRSILKWEDATTWEIDRMKALPGVEAAQAEAERRSAANLKALVGNKSWVETGGDVPITFPPEVTDFVARTYRTADCILEYGTGGSTRVGVELGVRKLMAVESSADWANTVRRTLSEVDSKTELHVLHADIGQVKKWGRPVDRQGHQRYHLYPMAIWDEPFFEHPDMVLIDGRFRVACFLTTMFRSRRPVTVLFDDYTDRPDYHFVERYSPVRDRIGRMAVFDVEPRPLEIADLSDVLGWYQAIE